MGRTLFCRYNHLQSSVVPLMPLARAPMHPLHPMHPHGGAWGARGAWGHGQGASGATPYKTEELGTQCPLRMAVPITHCSAHCLTNRRLSALTKLCFTKQSFVRLLPYKALLYKAELVRLLPYKALLCTPMHPIAHCHCPLRGHLLAPLWGARACRGQ